MQHYSREYMDKLIAEHRLVSASINQIQQTLNNFARNHGNDPVAGALTNLKIRRVELEAMIDVLTEYLN